jgi:arsenite-transporting ATPase
MPPRLLFFTGKGGVGKSTLSAIYALAHAKQGRSVVLVSMDPAHNLADIFERDSGEEVVECIENLRVCEPDVRTWSERYLRDIEEQLRASYRYLTSLNIDKYFGLLRHSPGLDEYAMSLIFRAMLRQHATCDIIVFDMPPTALTLRFFAAPSISSMWAKELIALRRSIMERKQMITTVTLGSRTIESDKVMRRLEVELANYAEVEASFRGERTTMYVLVNSDKLSRREARRIIAEVEELNLPTPVVLFNKSTGGTSISSLPLRRAGEVVEFPLSDVALTGIAALERYLEGVGTAFIEN